MDQVLLLTLLCLMVSVVVFLWLNLLFNTNKSGLPPGRTGWPVIGEMVDFISTRRQGHPEKFIFERTAKYSSTVFRTHLLGDNVAVFCGAQGNKFLFSNENKLVRAWWPTSYMKIFRSKLGRASATDYEAGIRWRKLTANFLKPESLHQYVGVMDRVAQRHFAEEWETKEQVVVSPLAKDYTFSVVCLLFLREEDRQLVDRLAKPFAVTTSGLVSMIPINFPGTALSKALKAANHIRKELVSITRQRKIDLAEKRASPTQDILSRMLISYYRDDQNGDHHDQLLKMKEIMEIADSVLGLMVAAHDTVSSACVCIASYLSDLPQIYDRVYQEQIEIAKAKGPGELLSWEDLQKMKYSWNVACEVLRLAPPLLGGFKEAIADISYNGFTIPKGWKLHWNANSTHQNPDFFPEPNKFDPSRFQGSGPAPYTFVPFGGGPRMCPGNEYARLAILVFMHHLVKRFRWEKIIPDEKIVLVDMMSTPAKGLPVRLFAHKPT